MTSLTLRSELTMGIQNSKLSVSKIYKSYAVDNVNNLTISLAPLATKTLDLTDSSFLFFTPDTYGMENEPISLTLNTATDSLVLTGLSYFMCSTLNLVSAVITNTGTQAVELVVVY